MHKPHADNYIAEGNACFRSNRMEEAAACFRKAADADPASFVAHANLGNTLLGLDRYEEAIQAYLKALALKPAAPLVARNLGECFEKTNRLDMAERYYRHSLEIRPDQATTYVDLGNAAQKQGNLAQAMQHYRRALELDPASSVAQHNAALCLYDDRNLGAAEQAFRAAVDMDPKNTLGTCFLGVILEHQGKHAEAEPILARAANASAFNRCLIDSARYAFRHGKHARYFSNTADLLRHALGHADADGLYLEFGVYYGGSLNVIAGATGCTVHGFDSFAGLPESWFVGDAKGPLATEPSGAYTTRGYIPVVPANAELHAGWFDDTLPAFVESHTDSVSFMNVDCDIYSSTKTIFDCLAGRIRPGTVIVFDEYFCYPEWRDHEYKAFQEWLSTTDYGYEYLAFSYFTSQAAVKILAG